MEELLMKLLAGNEVPSSKSEVLDESAAITLVESMHHKEGHKIMKGEKFSMHKAKELYSRYHGVLPHNTTVPEIYVAINAQYHDYSCLYRAWFGDNIDQKVIESAMIFWFKDEDYTEGKKVLKYFMD